MLHCAHLVSAKGQLCRERLSSEEGEFHGADGRSGVLRQELGLAHLLLLALSVPLQKP